jgi:hypothetical protein
MNSDESLKLIEEVNVKIYKVYPKRYIVIVLFGFSSASFMLLFNTFIPQANNMKDMYDTSNSVVFLLTNIILLMTVPGTIIANYCIDNKGIRFSALIYSVNFIIAAWLRCLINVKTYGIYIVVIGCAQIGFCQPFLFNALNKISAAWFRP